MNTQSDILSNEMTIKTDFSELSKVREFIILHAEAIGFSDIEASNISLAVDEACTNIIRHTFKLDPLNNFNLKIEINGNYFIITINDCGNSFNPIEYPEPNMGEYLKQFKRGGLGIHIIKKIMDEINYIPANDSNHFNSLQLKKALPLH